MRKGGGRGRWGEGVGVNWKVRKQPLEVCRFVSNTFIYIHTHIVLGANKKEIDIPYAIEQFLFLSFLFFLPLLLHCKD